MPKRNLASSSQLHHPQEVTAESVFFTSIMTKGKLIQQNQFKGKGAGAWPCTHGCFNFRKCWSSQADSCEEQQFLEAVAVMVCQ